MTRFIVEADGASRGNPGHAAYGAVVLHGETLEVVAERAAVLGHATNNVAEYRGLIAGLTAVSQVDAQAVVEVRMDSKLVVEQMSGRWQIKHPDMRDLARRAQSAFPPGQVAYTWVPRAQNKLADALVNEMIDRALAGDPSRIARLDGVPAEDATAEDVVGSIDVERTRAVVGETAGRTNVMVGWADVGVPTTTLLARHGATALSLEKRFSGRGGFDAPLAPLGTAQAQALAAEIEIGRAHV